MCGTGCVFAGFVAEDVAAPVLTLLLLEFERLMADADERTREVLERYGGLYPVTFGHCGYPGLCVRGTARSLCLDCPFLVRRP